MIVQNVIVQKKKKGSDSSLWRAITFPTVWKKSSFNSHSQNAACRGMQLLSSSSLLFAKSLNTEKAEQISK